MYQVAQAFARNTGRKFIPDPEGVSPIAEPRRWAQMLSSLLRFGDAKHLEPVDMKNTPELPGWSDKLSQDEAAGRLAMAEYSYVKKWIPEIESLRISPDGTTTLHSDGHSLGTDPGSAFEGLLSGGRDPRVTGIGPTTLRRALITRMAATGHPVDFKKPSLGVLDDDRSPLLGGDSGGAQDAGSVLRRGESGNETGEDLATRSLYAAAAPRPEAKADTEEEVRKLTLPRVPGAAAVAASQAGLKNLLLPSWVSKAHLAAAETLGAKLGPMNRRAEAVNARLKKDLGWFRSLGVGKASLDIHDNPGMKFMSAR